MSDNNSKYRIEYDALGPVNVPHGALYGAYTVRAIHNFKISGRTAHPALLIAYLHTKRAAATANVRAGVVEPAIGKLIVEAVDQLLAMSRESWNRIFPLDPYQAGAGTSQNMNVNEVIANLANHRVGKDFGVYFPVHPTDHVNRSQSTNDTYPTAMRLALIDISLAFIIELVRLSRSFNQKAEQWRHLLKAGRTHLRDAVPITLGQEFKAYSETIRKCMRIVRSARDLLRELNIGGTAVGTGINVPKNYRYYVIDELQRLTGEKLTSASDLIEATQSQLPIANFMAAMKLTAIEVSRISNDLRLMSSGPVTGLGEISLPSVQPGSSIMPGKLNPSIPEMVNQVCFSIIGYEQTTAKAVMAGQLELNVMMPVMAYSALESAVIGTNAIKALTDRCVLGIEAHEKVLNGYFESTTQIATVLTPELGYEKTAELVKEALEKRESIIALVREKHLLDDRKIDELIDPKILIREAS